MATYYWVGSNTVVWDNANTSSWATTSGGTGGAGVPTSTDDVVFDTNSNLFDKTITIGSAVSGTSGTCRDITVSSSNVIFSLTWSSSLQVYGNVNITGINNNFGSGTIPLKSQSPGKKFNQGGRTNIIGNITFDGVGGEWTLQDTVYNASTITLTSGNVYLNNCNTISRLFYLTGPNAKLIDTGSNSQIIVSGSSSVAPFQVPVTSSNISVTGTYPLVNIAINNGGFQLTSAMAANLYESNCFSLIITNTGLTTGYSLGSWRDFTVPSGISVSTGVFGTAGIFYGNVNVSSTLSSTGTMYLRGSSFITKTVKRNDGVIGTSTSWYIDSANSTYKDLGTGTYDFSPHAFYLNTGTLDLCGKTYSPYAGGGNIFFGAGTNKTIIANGGSIISSDWTTTGVGTFTGLTILPGINSGSKLTLYSSTAKSFNTGGIGDYSPFTLEQAGKGALTIVGTNNFNDIRVNSVVNLAGSEISNGTNSIIYFTGGSTTTLNSFTLLGSSNIGGNTITITSNNTTNFILSKSSGTVMVSNATISRSTATGGAQWYAPPTLGNTNNGNNIGWLFANAYNGYQLLPFFF